MPRRVLTTLDIASSLTGLLWSRRMEPGSPKQLSFKTTASANRAKYFTSFDDCAYMHAMAHPALVEAFENLSAQTKSRTEPEVHGEVVSLTIGNVIKLVDKILESRQRLRVSFIKAYHSASRVFDAQDSDDDVIRRAETVVAMKEALHVVSRPYLARGDGSHSLLSPAKTLRSMSVERSADRRILRRQAKRIDEAAELCEAQRLKLVELGTRAVAFVESKAGDGFDEAVVDAICRRSVERFPIVNAYLAQ